MKDSQPINTSQIHQKDQETLFERKALSAKIWLEGFGITQSLIKMADPAALTEHTTTLHEKLVTQLMQLSEKKQIKIDTLFLGAFIILLHRLATSGELAYGMANSPSHAKSSLEIFQLTGSKSAIDLNESLEDFIKKLQDEKINHSGDETLAHTHILNYLFISKDETHSKSNPINLIPKEHSLALFFDKANWKKLTFLYNPHKLTQDSLDFFAEHFILTLEALCNTPTELVTRFNLLTPNEKSNLLDKWSHPKEKYNKQLCVHEMIEESAKTFPNHLSLSKESTQIQFKDMNAYANQLGRLLIQEGVEPGDLVAVIMERTPYCIIAMLAILKIGATYVPINPRYLQERTFYILNDCKPKLILTNRMELIPQEMQFQGVFFENETTLAKFNRTDIGIKVRPEQSAYIVYTTGNGHKPKGVVIKHESLTNLTFCYKKFFKITEKDRASQFSSHGFDTFFSETLPLLAYGASIHIIDDNTKLVPSIFVPWLKEHEITICDLPTAYAQLLFSGAFPSNLNLRILKLGGDRVTRLPSHQLTFDIWNTFGSTETTIECIIGKIYEANSMPPSKIVSNTPPPLGKPIPNAEVYIVDQHHQAVPVGIVGEILVGGDCVSAGFYNNEGATREAYIKNPFNSHGSMLFKTGDLARWLPNGEIEFIGRYDLQIKIHGYAICLNEIETTLCQFPDVNEVVVAVREIMGRPKTLVAYLVPNMEKIRIPYHEPCLANMGNNKILELITDDISKEGLAISGLMETLPKNNLIRVFFKLPDALEPQWFQARVMWQDKLKAGIRFETSNEERALISESIDRYLLTHNLMDVLYNVSAKRNYRNALRQRLPEYMIPLINVLPSLPLTYNGKIDWKSLPPPVHYELFLDRNMVPPKTNIEKKLCHWWKDILNATDISMTDSFFDLGGTSYTLTQFLLQVEKEFGVIITPHVLIDLCYIPIIAEYIESKGKTHSHYSPIAREIRQDLVLPEDIAPIKKPSAQTQKILITGVSGFLGLFILREVLQQTDAKIYCLLRQANAANPLQRLKENAEQYHLLNEIPLEDRRIAVLNCDLGAHNLGLSTEQYNQLSETVDTIYHCGSQVNLLMPYLSLRHSNVLSTAEVIRFATHRQPKHIHYISTFDAATHIDTMGSYLEEFPKLSEAPDLVGGYAMTKWVSERLLGEISNRGLPVNLYRASHITGISDSGLTQTNDAFLYLLKGCIELGFAPDWHEKVTLLPIDFVSRALVALSLHHSDKSHVYHLIDPQGIMWTDLIASLNAYGYNIQLISESEWQSKLLKIPAKNALYPLLTFYLSQKATAHDAHMQQTIRILEQMNITYPRIDDMLLKKYFDFLRSIHFFPDKSPE